MNIIAKPTPSDNRKTVSNDRIRSVGLVEVFGARTDVALSCMPSV
jgi:hypothetical protein